MPEYLENIAKFEKNPEAYSVDDQIDNVINEVLNIGDAELSASELSEADLEAEAINEEKILEEVDNIHEEIEAAQPQIQQEVYKRFTPIAMQKLKEAGLTSEQLKNVEDKFKEQSISAV